MKVASQIFKKPVTIKQDADIGTAIRLFYNLKLSTLPVVNDKKKLVGIIAEKDILQKLLPSFEELLSGSDLNSSVEIMEENLPLFMKQSVRMLMSTDPKSVKMDTPILKAQSIMMLNGIHRLPVVNDKKEVVGIITQTDVFRALASKEIPNMDIADFYEWTAPFFEDLTFMHKKTETEVPALEKLFQKSNAYRILEISPTTGLLSIELSKRGYNVTAISEYSPFHKQALKNLRNISFNLKNPPEFVHQKYSEFLKSKKNDFDAIVFMANSPSHSYLKFKEIIPLIDKASVKKNAVVIMQITNYDKFLKHHGGVQSFRIVENPSSHRQAFLEFFTQPNKKAKTIEFTISAMGCFHGTWKNESVNSTTISYIDDTDLIPELKKHGFKKISVYGSNSFDNPIKEKLDRDEHDWINIVAER